MTIAGLQHCFFLRFFDSPGFTLARDMFIILREERGEEVKSGLGKGKNKGWGGEGRDGEGRGEGRFTCRFYAFLKR